MFKSKLVFVAFYAVTVHLFVTMTFYLQDITPEDTPRFLLNIALVLILSVIIGLIWYNDIVAPLIKQRNELDKLVKETLHELNLPVATIDANIKMIEKRCGEDEKVRVRVGRVQKATEHLQQLYKELEYLIKKHVRRVVKEEFDLSRLIRERMSLIETVYPNISFDVTLEPTHIVSDQFGVAKVVDNILDNAIKYSNYEGHIDVILVNAKLTIIDQGQGIDPVNLLHIYQRYTQEDSGKKGFGIGLALVKTFCDEHDIALRIDSQIGEGTRVSLDFDKLLVVES
jgi:signal transduction histidine kinase